MHRTLLIVPLLIFVSFITNAQEETKARKNDIGFSVRFFNNPTTPFNIMYKRQLGSTLALRVGMAVSVTAQRTNATDNTSYNKFTTSAMAPSVGVEWQKHLAKNFTFYAGADFRTSLTSNKSEDFSNNVLVNQSFAEVKTFSLSPFIALRYNIIDQLYVATEANLNFLYSESTNTNTNIPSGSTSTNKSYSYQMILQPAVGLFFFYRF